MHSFCRFEVLPPASKRPTPSESNEPSLDFACGGFGPVVVGFSVVYGWPVAGFVMQTKQKKGGGGGPGPSDR